MKAKTVFYCTECGNETAKWAGRCPACGAWNSIVEQAALKASAAGKGRTKALARSKAHPIAELQTEQELRFSTGMGELDRVLGGGAVKGSLVLVGGAPGIGKSTLMLQICSQLCRFAKVLYVSGEESPHQLKMRAERLKVASGNLYVLSETCLGDVLECVSEEAPDILIVDSIQTLYNEELDSPAGSVSQVKDCTMTLMQLAKNSGVATHGGSDFYPTHFFIEKILGHEDGKWSIDVYQAVDMGICGILAFRSILNGNMPIKVPNLRNKEERDAWRHDNACTNAAVAGDQVLPCSSYPERTLDPEEVARNRAIWEKRQGRG